MNQTQGEYLNPGMMKRLIIIVLMFLITGCSEQGYANRKKIEFSSGKSAEVVFEKQVSTGNELVLVVDYKTDEIMIKEETVETEVFEIWKQVAGEAEDAEITEGIIRYRFFTGENFEDGQPVYRGMLFAAEKLENGNWKIDKIF